MPHTRPHFQPTIRARDPNLIEKITTEYEFSGLFNWALKGLKRLLEKGKFTQSKTAEEIQAAYDEMSDPITAFINSCITVDPDKVVTKDHLYNAYFQFCKMKGFTTVLKQTFSKEIKPRVLGLKEGRRTIDRARD